MLFLPQVMKIKGQLPLSITFNFPRLSIKPGKERVAQNVTPGEFTRENPYYASLRTIF